jgi:hypothetical protein
VSSVFLNLDYDDKGARRLTIPDNWRITVAGGFKRVVAMIAQHVWNPASRFDKNKKNPDGASR